ETLLYDFSLQKGDSINYNFTPAYNLSGYYVVDSIVMLHDYKNFYRRHFYLQNHSQPGNFILELIEGVGNTSHPLFLYYYFSYGFMGVNPQCPASQYDLA